jgi:urease accessory protein
LNASAGWRARLTLDYRREGERTIAHDQHEGPLRVLQRLYPEGPAICHHVLVHPPGGLVGGDSLQLDARLGGQTHAVLTTPGATRFYRSEGAIASQQVSLSLGPGARLEWLPLETIAHSGCQARNGVQLQLDPDAEAIGWDLLALGLPAAGEPFTRGRWQHRIELPEVWLERGVIDAQDRRLMQSPLGLAGRTVLGTLWMAFGHALSDERRDRLLEAARSVGSAAPDRLHDDRALSWGVTACQDQVLVLRLLGQRVEPAMRLFRRVRAAWRREAWGLEEQPPRIWQQ